MGGGGCEAGETSIDLSRLKAFADDNLNVAKIMDFDFDKAETIVEKRENVDNEPLLTMFSKCFYLESLKNSAELYGGRLTMCIVYFTGQSVYR